MDLTKMERIRGIPDTYEDGHLEITREADSRTAECPRCHSKRKSPGIVKSEHFFHIDMGGKLIGVTVRKRRYKCLDCKKQYTHDLGEPVKSYTKEFCEHILERVDAGEGYKDFKKEYGLSTTSYQNILNWRYNKDRDKQGYELPPFIVLVKIKVSGKDTYLIFDLLEMSLLDAIEESELETLRDNPGYKELEGIYLYDLESLEIVDTLFPEKPLSFFKGVIRKMFLEALMKDARRLDIADYEADVEKIVYEMDEIEFKKAMKYDMGIVSVMANVKAIDKFMKGEEYSIALPIGDLNNYKETYFGSQIPERLNSPFRHVSKVPNRILNQFTERLEPFLKEIDKRNKRIAFDSQTGCILFEGDFIPKIEKDGRIYRNSGRLI